MFLVETKHLNKGCTPTRIPEKKHLPFEAGAEYAKALLVFQLLAQHAVLNNRRIAGKQYLL